MRELKFYANEPGMFTALFYHLKGKEKYEWFDESRRVSQGIRETLESSGLVRIEKKEYETKEGKRIREIIEYPAVKIRFDDYNLYLDFELLLGQTGKQWESKHDVWEHTFKYKTASFKVEMGTASVVLKHSNIDASRVIHKPLGELRMALGYMSDGIAYYNFTTTPHLLICGDSGTGKSTLLRNIFVQFEKDWIVEVCDGKRVEFSFLKRYGFNVADDKDQCIEKIELVYNIMMDRMEQMKEADCNMFTDMELKPCFLIVDELIHIVGRLEKDEKKHVMELITSIGTLGRSAGVNLILIMQRPDSKFIDTIIRDNMKNKIVLGDASEAAYEMCFGSENRRITPLSMGRGYVSIDGKIKEMAVPNYSQKQFDEDLCGIVGRLRLTRDLEGTRKNRKTAG